jgi:hypothetical protein
VSPGPSPFRGSVLRTEHLRVTETSGALFMRRRNAYCYGGAGDRPVFLSREVLPVATTRPLSEILPKEMTELKVRPIFTLLLDVQPAINVGKTPGVDRRVGVITGGRFEGERLRGTLLPGGSDWQAIRPGDGAWLLNVRIVLKTDDDAIIGMSYPGLRHGPKEVLDRIARGEVVKATDYYLRISATFETASEKYGWLNNIISVGVGHRLPEGPIYQMFEVL